MLLIGAILAIGLLIGWGFGGDLRNFSAIGIRLWWVAPLALLLQVLPLPEGESGITRLLPAGALLASFWLLTVVAAANWRLRGFGLILIGVLMNFTVISVNQGMPVSAEALARIEATEDVEPLREAPEGAKHHLATEEDRLRPIGDVIPVEEPFDVVVSPGDVLAYSGAAVLVAAVMLGRPERRRREQAVPEDAQTTMWS